VTLEELQVIASEISCEIGQVAWRVHCGRLGTGFFLQLRYSDRDVVTRAIEEQHARKWYLSSHAVKSEVVQTVLKACLTSAEHMVREHFTYRGVPIFGPHFDVDRLVDLVGKGQTVQDLREEKV
jgi:hypothetical protein